MIFISGNAEIVASQPVSDEDVEENEIKVKSLVRQRDNERCRDCGITSDEHIEAHGKKLHVHRIIPGTVYREDLCVTLCYACHGKKPKKTGEAFWAKDLAWLGFNLYDANDKESIGLLGEMSKLTGKSIGDLLDTAIRDFVEHVKDELAISSAAL